jgi:hypothetical protein
VKSILRRRPSPALVISMIALFVSLSGVSYGVANGFIDSREIKNNEIRSLDIRNNQIRTKDLRNNEIRGIDIRNSTVQGRDVALNTLTGDDIAESRLGKVPSATAADTATSATTAGSVGTLKIIPPTSVAKGGAPVALATHGPLTLSGRCTEATGTRAQLFVATTEDNSAAGAEPPGGAPPATDHPDLDSGQGPQQIAEFPDATTPGRSVDITQVFASAPSGKAFTGQVAMYADDSGAGSCLFHGHLALQG